MKTIEIGSFDEVLIIDKVFGPTVFSNLKITADADSGCWIIERMWIETCEYIEWCRIPGQIDQEFSDVEEK